MASKGQESLLKYNNPNLVSTQHESKKPKAVGKGGSGAKAGKSKQEKSKQERDQDYLNSILPPHEYMENGALWIRYVSPQPATQVDVINLQEQLENALHK